MFELTAILAQAGEAILDKHWLRYLSGGYYAWQVLSVSIRLT
jgi:hypothetical protein